MAITPRVFPSLSKRISSGVFVLTSVLIMEAILPISVSMPVPTTTPKPLPLVIIVDIKPKFNRSPKAVFGSVGVREASFSEGTDSPVNDDSSTCRFTDAINRISAAMILPASRIRISPGTIFSESISFTIPFRRTSALGNVSCCRASIAFPAFTSCTTPSTALIVMTSRMITASTYSPIKMVITTAPKRI